MSALYGAAGHFIDVSQILADLKGESSWVVSNQHFGDPCFGKFKALVVTQPDGQIRYYPEGAEVHFSEPEIPTISRPLYGYYHLLVGKSGLEIGGPSLSCADLDIYTAPARIDNLIFSSQTLWSCHQEGQEYTFPGKLAPGKVHIADVVEMKSLPDAGQDFVFASHVLEHLVNPLRALQEITRILKPEGLCILILPYPPNTFDHRRPITPVSELIQHYQEGRDESDVLDHLPGILPYYDLSRDPGAGTLEQFIERCKDHVHNRALHVHVFDFKLIIECLTVFGYQIIDMQLSGLHQVVVGQKKLI